MRTRDLLKMRNTCINGCLKPVCPPSKTLCKKCLRIFDLKKGFTLERDANTEMVGIDDAIYFENAGIDDIGCKD
jgi:hypothetical protein